MTTGLLTAADLDFNPGTHRSTDPGGHDVPHVTFILAETGVSTDFEDLACLSPRVEEAIRYRCALGTAVHADCHAYDDDDLVWSSVNPESQPFVQAWVTCRANLGLVPLTRERQIFHPVHRYTGFLDGIFLLPTGRRVLGDLKIGDPNDAAAEFQTAAYEAAYLSEHPDERIDERWAIRLCPDLKVPYRITNYTAPDRPEAWRDFQKFLAFLTTYHEQATRRRVIR